jgi:hypothetical protein
VDTHSSIAGDGVASLSVVMIFFVRVSNMLGQTCGIEFQKRLWSVVCVEMYIMAPCTKYKLVECLLTMHYILHLSEEVVSS